MKAEVHTEGIQRRSNCSLARMMDKEPEASAIAEYKALLRPALTQGRPAYDGGFKALRMP